MNLVVSGRNDSYLKEGWQMNKENIEIVKMDICRNFKYHGELYYIEVFHYIDGTIQAFANERPGIVQHILEEFPIGIGRDDHDPIKAAIKAIDNIQYQ
jgi:hypothetical protein